MKQFLFLSFVAFAMYSCAPVEGCTDPLATNYAAEADEDDGSCLYNATCACYYYDYDYYLVEESTTYTNYNSLELEAAEVVCDASDISYFILSYSDGGCDWTID